jgi:hypothetical protein
MNAPAEKFASNRSCREEGCIERLNGQREPESAGDARNEMHEVGKESGYQKKGPRFLNNAWRSNRSGSFGRISGGSGILARLKMTVTWPSFSAAFVI